ncbi:hypothetical protein QTP11_14020 [Klebsiella oxytoca]|nr:hypothetical protein [Klebsiella oxytoca]MDM4255051.1 hypothetical protein [Klebsiella oxytoca]
MEIHYRSPIKTRQDKHSVGLVASSIIYMEHVCHYRKQAIQRLRVSDPRYIEMAEQNAKK